MHNRGFSLIELMVAMVIGLFVTTVVISVFVSANRSFALDEEFARMQENARFAMRVLSDDLSMAGFWGPMLTAGSINETARNCDADGSGAECQGFYAGSVLSLTTDCGPGTVTPTPAQWAYSVSSFIEVVKQSTASNANATYGCIDGSDFQEDTDVLVIKRTQGEPLLSTRAESADSGKVFLRSSGAAGMLLVYDHADTASTSADISDWTYLVHIYYIQNHFATSGDGIPSLFRKTLGGPAGATAMQTEDGGVAPGIEYFHIMFGIDTNGDGVADAYKSVPTASEIAGAISARIYVLARSMSQDIAYTNNKSYQLGDVTKDFSGSPDNFHRRVFMTTVKIRNQVNRITLSS